MPLDGTLTDTPLSRRLRLASALREGVEDWDFRNSETCAIGLACRLGLIPTLCTDRLAEDLGEAFGMNYWQLRAAFGLGLPCGTDLQPDTMTPAMVADALDRVK